MSSIRRRALVAVTGLLAVAAPLAAAPASSAHTCAEVDVYKNYAKTAVGSCHSDGTPGPADVCTGGGVAPLGYGAGTIVCVHVPVAANP
jgi:hypothetical protein